MLYISYLRTHSMFYMLCQNTYYALPYLHVLMPFLSLGMTKSTLQLLKSYLFTTMLLKSKMARGQLQVPVSSPTKLTNKHKNVRNNFVRTLETGKDLNSNQAMLNEEKGNLETIGGQGYISNTVDLEAAGPHSPQRHKVNNNIQTKVTFSTACI